MFPGRAQNGLSFEQRSRSQERILNQRLEQAEHLRSISADNQNARLGEAAARMEQNAQQRFADQNQRLDSFQNRGPVPGAYQVGVPQTGYEDGGSSNRFGPEQLRAYEERMVQQRLNQASGLGQSSAYDGYTREPHAASRIPQNAQTRFHRSFPAPNVDQYVPQHPGMGNPQIAPSLPPHLQSFRNPFLGQNTLPSAQQNLSMPQPQVAQPTPPAMHSFQNTFPGQNVNQQMPQYPSVGGRQAVPSAPPAMAKKPSVFEKMRGLWPFK
jgi:hypothetical protein